MKKKKSLVVAYYLTLTLLAILAYDISQDLKDFQGMIFAVIVLGMGAMYLDGFRLMRQVKELKTPDPEIDQSDQKKKAEMPVLILAYREVNEIAKTIQNFKDKKFENIFVWVDGSENGTYEKAVSVLGKERVFWEPNLGKVGATQMAAKTIAHKYLKNQRYVYLSDADVTPLIEDIPLTYMEKNNIKGLAFNVIPVRGSKESTLERRTLISLETYEYQKSMALGRKFLSKNHSVTCISGAAGVFEIETLLEILEEETGKFPGDDNQRTLRILKSGGKVMYTGEVVLTVAPSTLGELHKQRSQKWWPGFWTNLPLILKLFKKKGTSFETRRELLYEFVSIILDPLKIAFVASVIGYQQWYILFSMYVMYTTMEFYAYNSIKKNEGLVPDAWVILVWPIYFLFQIVWRWEAVFYAIIQHKEHKVKMKEIEPIKRSILSKLKILLPFFFGLLSQFSFSQEKLNDSIKKKNPLIVVPAIKFVNDEYSDTFNYQVDMYYKKSQLIISTKPFYKIGFNTQFKLDKKSSLKVSASERWKYNIQDFGIEYLYPRKSFVYKVGSQVYIGGRENGTSIETTIPIIHGGFDYYTKKNWKFSTMLKKEFSVLDVWYLSAKADYNKKDFWISFGGHLTTLENKSVYALLSYKGYFVGTSFEKNLDHTNNDRLQIFIGKKMNINF